MKPTAQVRDNINDHAIVIVQALRQTMQIILQRFFMSMNHIAQWQEKFIRRSNAQSRK